MRLRALSRILALFLGVLLAVPSASAAESLPEPKGPVVLTVAGAIGRTNRPPFDPAADGVLKHHDVAFEKAAGFDLAMLEALGMHEIEVGWSGWPKSYRFEGPWLADLLKAVDATGRTLRILALDGYSAELTAAEVADRPWMVALKQDGRPLAIGGRGPLWVLYAPPGGEGATDEDEQRWPWAVFYIAVE